MTHASDFINQWRLSGANKYTYLRQLILDVSVMSQLDQSSLTLKLGLEEIGTRFLSVKFSGVTALRAIELGSNWPVALILEDVAARGWDRTSFSVRDAEETITFYCEHIEVLNPEELSTA